VATDDHTVRLDPDTYSVLESEAGRRNVPLDALAGELLRERLAETSGEEGTPERMRAALAALSAIRAQVKGPVDAIRLVREGREELERRSLRWPSS